jgi:hypothetical protein
MARALVSKLLPAVLLAVGSPLLAGCSAEPGAKKEQVATGTVSVPLVTETNGNVYRLNASIYVSGPTPAYLSSSEDPNETALCATLSTGTYWAELYSSWNLQKRGADGVFRSVLADLKSSSWSSFQILNGTTTTLSYEFETDGVDVIVGQGNLNVVIDVTERAPLCAALGNDCGEGAWCPPSDFTGAGPACVPSGSVALEEACSDPLSCVAGASCFDLGAGPVCVALCAKSDFDQPCAGGGVCQAVLERSYGLCR